MPVVDARVIVVWNVPAGKAVNTMDARFDDATVSPQQAAELIRDQIEGTFIQQMTADCGLSEVKVGDDVSGGSASSSANGGLNFQTANPSVSYGITKQVAAGRNGRWFLPGVPEEGNDDKGFVPANTRQDINAHFANFISNVEAGGVEFFVLQKDLTTPKVETMTCRDYITLQSRRLKQTRGF